VVTTDYLVVVTAMRTTDEYVSSFSKGSIEIRSHRLVYLSEKRETVTLYHDVCSIHHEGIWESGGITSLILNLDIRLGE
jgi:hypothetical protein